MTSVQGLAVTGVRLFVCPSLVLQVSFTHICVLEFVLIASVEWRVCNVSDRCMRRV